MIIKKLRHISILKLSAEGLGVQRIGWKELLELGKKYFAHFISLSKKILSGHQIHAVDC
jgi:hypothetical protein